MTTLISDPALLSAAKKSLRRSMRAVRRNIFGDRRDYSRRSLAIEKRIASSAVWKESSDLLLYASFRDEVETSWLLDLAWEQGKSVALPRCRPDSLNSGGASAGIMDFFVCRSRDELEISELGIPEPLLTLPLWREHDTPSLLLAPGLAFDRRGGRLGYGGGFYDRWLGREDGKLRTVALAFADQLVDDVPCGAWDTGVQGICTEEELIWV